MSLRQANEDLRRSLQINKSVISELVSGNHVGLEQLLKGNVWDIEVALHESRAKNSELSKKVAALERENR